MLRRQPGGGCPARPRRAAVGQSHHHLAGGDHEPHERVGRTVGGGGHGRARLGGQLRLAGDGAERVEVGVDALERADEAHQYGGGRGAAEAGCTKTTDTGDVTWEGRWAGGALDGNLCTAAAVSDKH